MEELSNRLKRIRYNQMKMNEFCRSIVKESCLKQKCADADTLFLVFDAAWNDQISIGDISKLLSLDNMQTFDDIHIPCAVRIAHCLFNVLVVKKPNLQADGDFRKSISGICLQILLIADELFPVSNEYEASSAESFKRNLIMNANTVETTLSFYMDILFSESGRSVWSDMDLSGSVVTESSFQKCILRKSICEVLIVLSCRIGKHPWTNKELMKSCVNSVNCICFLTKHPNVTSLFCGLQEDCALFPEGLSNQLFDSFGKIFTKGTCKKSVLRTHSLIWCVTKIKYPHLGTHVSKVVPMLLLLIDDYSTQNKLLGISTMQYVIQNVNSSDLCLYNHAHVIYDALFKQLYSNKDSLYEIAIPCLLHILCVIEQKSRLVDTITYTLFDKAFEKILQNIDFTSSLHRRKICLSSLPGYILKMGGNIIKHLEKLIETLVSSLAFSDGESEHLRLYALDALQQTIYSAWPVIKRYKKVILKCSLKLLLDLSNTQCSEQAKVNLSEKVSAIFVSLRECCDNSFDDEIRTILQTDFCKENKLLFDVLESVVVQDSCKI